MMGVFQWVSSFSQKRRVGSNAEEEIKLWCGGGCFFSTTHRSRLCRPHDARWRSVPSFTGDESTVLATCGNHDTNEYDRCQRFDVLPEL